MNLKKYLFIVFLLIAFSVFSLGAGDINFPPELMWWIYELNKVNPNVKVSEFVLSEHITQEFINDSNVNRFLVYPVFMRWNYSGNRVAYYDHNGVRLRRQSNGKYLFFVDDYHSRLYFANRNTIFFIDYFGSSIGVDSYNWLTDTVLVAVGHWANPNSDENNIIVDAFIRTYTINTNNTIDVRTYLYESAIRNNDRFDLLRLRWYEQRPDYFEFE